MKKPRLIGTLYASIAIILVFLAISNSHAKTVIWVTDQQGNLGTVDSDTGNVNIIGNMGFIMLDIAFHPNGNLYGATSGNLYSINTTTATASFIGGNGMINDSLSFDSNGTLYYASSELYAVDLGTGIPSLVGSGGDVYNSSGDLAYIDGALYLSSATATDDTLVRIDPTTGVGTLIGDIGAGLVWGMATDNYIDLYGVSTDDKVFPIDVVTGAMGTGVSFGGQGLDIVLDATAQVVPIPPAIWLLGSGLIAIVGIRRKLRN